MIKKILLMTFVFLFFSQPMYAGVDFSGSNVSDEINVPYNSSMDVANNLSVAVWVKPDATSAQFVTRDNSGGSLRSWGLIGGASNKLAASVFKSGDGETVIQESTGSMTTGEWQHIAMTYLYVSDGSSELRIYRNGVEVGNSTTAVGVIQTTATDLAIGRRQYTSFETPYNGKMSDVAIWNVTLTATEINTLYSSRVKRMPLNIQPNGLIGYYPLDDHDVQGTINGLKFMDLSSSNLVGTGVDTGDASATYAEEILSYQ